MERLAQIRTVYVGKSIGSAEFARLLTCGLERLGLFEIAGSRSAADAIAEVQGANTDEGFVGTLTIRDMQGTVLWSAQALRPYGSTGPMAYEQLLAQLRAARVPKLGTRQRMVVVPAMQRHI